MWTAHLKRQYPKTTAITQQKTTTKPFNVHKHTTHKHPNNCPPTTRPPTSAKQNQLRRLYFFVNFPPGDKCVLIEEAPIEPKTPVSARRRPLSSRIHKINKELLDTDSNYNCNLDNDEDENDDDS